MKFLIISDHFAKFNGHRSCGSRDTAAKIVYVTLQDHVIKVSGEFMEENSSLYIPTLPKLIAIDMVHGYAIILACHVILQDHVIIWTCDFKGSTLSM